MPDKVRPEVSITLDKERHIKLGIRACKRFEELTGKHIWAAKTWDDLSIEDISLLLWVGLLHEDPNLTADGVEELADQYSTPGIVANAMIQALGAAMAESKGGKGNTPKDPL